MANRNMPRHSCFLSFLGFSRFFPPNMSKTHKFSQRSPPFIRKAYISHILCRIHSPPRRQMSIRGSFYSVFSRTRMSEYGTAVFGYPLSFWLGCVRSGPIRQRSVTLSSTETNIVKGIKSANVPARLQQYPYPTPSQVCWPHLIFIPSSSYAFITRTTPFHSKCLPPSACQTCPVASSTMDVTNSLSP